MVAELTCGGCGEEIAWDGRWLDAASSGTCRIRIRPGDGVNRGPLIAHAPHLPDLANRVEVETWLND